MRVIVIMAGGSGTRFWPLSRKARPKQMLPMAGTQTMIAQSVDRARRLVANENVYVVAGAHLTEGLKSAVDGLPDENFLVEPEGRNTAPCLAFAAAVVAARHSADTLMGVLTSDHLIGNMDAFEKNVNMAFEYAAEKGQLMTIGITPTMPHTGYGYLELGEVEAEDGRGCVRKVLAFHEKPNEAKAKEYVESGHYLWNSGMFFWKVADLLSAFQTHCPELAEGAETIRQSVNTEAYESTVHDVFMNWPSDSIDYAVMEKADNVGAVASSFQWDDLGTWSALMHINDLDSAGNLLVGKCVAMETSNSILHNLPMGQCSVKGCAGGCAPLLATLGVDDLIVVHSPAAILVARRDREQDIKQLLQAVKEQGLEEYL